MQVQRRGDGAVIAIYQTGILAASHFGLECDNISSGTGEIRRGHISVVPRVVESKSGG